MTTSNPNLVEPAKDAESPEKQFALLLTAFFSPRELDYIKHHTGCGMSALDVVRQALRDAAKEYWAWQHARYPNSYSVRVDLPRYSRQRRRRTFIG